MAPPRLAPHPCPKTSHLNSTLHEATNRSQAVQTEMGRFSPASNQRLTQGTAPCSLENGDLNVVCWLELTGA